MRGRAEGAGQQARDVTSSDPRPALILGPDRRSACERADSAQGTESRTPMTHTYKHTHVQAYTMPCVHTLLSGTAGWQ